MHITRRSLASLALVLSLVLVPLTAFAVETPIQVRSSEELSAPSDSDVSLPGDSAADSQNVESVDEEGDAHESGESSPENSYAGYAEVDEDEQQLQAERKERDEVQAQLKEELERIEAENPSGTAALKTQSCEYVLEYDRSDIEEIGTQEQTGHTICCPSFSCAYADAVMDGTVHDHSYYTCSCCSWNDWGGGASVGRSAGSSEELLREAYDQIAEGKPTVIHVSHGGGEHWICLIGYQGAEDPDNLTLDNFVALDPWDGDEITASERYSLYGDGCQHLSSR